MKKISKPVGRPPKITKEIESKLRAGFLMGFSDEEACASVEISMTTLYEYQKLNPEFADKKNQWKKEPILKAKKTVAESLGKTKDAQWYLERKVKKEFSLRTEVTGKDGDQLIPTPIYSGEAVKTIEG